MVKNRMTKIYVTIITLVMVFAMTTLAYGITSKEGWFGYTANYPGQTYYTDPLIKSDDSSAIVCYKTGPSAANVMYVEMWGSQYQTSGYANYTCRHLYNGKYVTYYTVNKGETALLPNLVYETFGMTAYTKLKVYVTATGTVTGTWSTTTY